LDIETKGIKDFLKLSTTDADKVRCGERHFDVPGSSFAFMVLLGDV